MRALIVLVACYPFVATAETLNVKTGVWEITSTSTLSGAPGLPPELLEQLSDEQRAEVEKRLKDASDRAYTDVSRECVTELDLRNPFESANPDECTQRVVRSTRTEQEFELECTGTHPGTGTLRISAPTPETMTGVLDASLGKGNDAVKVKATLKGRWLGPDCDEADENEGVPEEEMDDEEEDENV